MADDHSAQIYALIENLKKSFTDVREHSTARPMAQGWNLMTADLPTCPICDSHHVTETHFHGSGIRAFACVLCGHNWTRPNRRLN